MMFIEPPVTLIPRPLPQPKSHPYNGSNDVDNDVDDVKFEPPAVNSSSASSTPTSSEGQGSFSSSQQQRPGSLDSGSIEQTDDGGHTARCFEIVSKCTIFSEFVYRAVCTRTSLHSQLSMLLWEGNLYIINLETIVLISCVHDRIYLVHDNRISSVGSGMSTQSTTSRKSTTSTTLAAAAPKKVNIYIDQLMFRPHLIIFNSCRVEVRRGQLRPTYRTPPLTTEMMMTYSTPWQFLTVNCIPKSTYCCSFMLCCAKSCSPSATFCG